MLGQRKTNTTNRKIASNKNIEGGGDTLSPTHPFGLITSTVITLRGLLLYQVGQIMEQVDF
jgi:hypothetical protein